MPAERQLQIVGMDTLAVVGHVNALDAALLDLDADATRLRIETVLEQFFDDRRRAFHHLAGGYLVRHQGVQLPDSLVHQETDRGLIWDPSADPS